MNFGKKKQSKKNFNDTNSVVSILTKGGTVVNPFSNKKRVNSKNADNINSQSSKSQNYSGSRIRGQSSADEDGHILEMASGEKEIRGSSFKKSNVHFDNTEDSGGEDNLRRKLYQKNEKMINVYMTAPYKVLTIDQISKKMTKEGDVYKAKNNLKVHTEFRTLKE